MLNNQNDVRVYVKDFRLITDLGADVFLTGGTSTRVV